MVHTFVFQEGDVEIVPIAEEDQSEDAMSEVEARPAFYISAAERDNVEGGVPLGEIIVLNLLIVLVNIG